MTFRSDVGKVQSMGPSFTRYLTLRPETVGRVRVAGADKRVVALTFLAISYNACLALINAHIAGIGFAAVAATEIGILGLCLCVLAKTGLKKSSRNVVYFLCVYLLITLVLSIANQTLFVDAFRNMLIIAIFVCLGREVNQVTVTRTFLLCSAVVLLFLLIELGSLPLYAGIFRPADYFVNTRGVANFELDESGIFRNALGFEGRFSFGIFTGPRTSSVFLEQVSLANYAAVLCVYLLSLWPRLGRMERIAHVLTIVLIILSNNTRTSSILLLLSLVGYFVYPYIPKYTNALIAPAIILLGVVVYALYPNVVDDDFVGRVSHTGKFIADMGWPEYFGLSLDKVSGLMDSGYPYVIYSTTVIGMVVYWLFVSFIVPQHTASQRRCANGLAMFIFINLLIGGTAVFSIKIAAPLWLLVGFMSQPHWQPAKPLRV